MSGGKRWTKDEDDELAACYGVCSMETLVNRLGRSEGAIKARAKKWRLGIRKKPRPRRNEAALAALDGTVILTDTILETIRQASGLTYRQVAHHSGYGISNERNLYSPALRKTIDIVQVMGFDLVLRRRA